MTRALDNRLMVAEPVERKPAATYCERRKPFEITFDTVRTDTDGEIVVVVVYSGGLDAKLLACGQQARFSPAMRV